MSSTCNDSMYRDNSANSNCIVTKLRRLRMEENLISKSIQTQICFDDQQFEENEQSEHIKYFLHKLRKSFIDCRDLYEEIKSSTTSRENLQSIDINSIKKDVLGLEMKIQLFKTSLQGQLKMLKSMEDHLVQEECEYRNEVVKKPIKTKVKDFSEIIPSPVKLLINSPFQCPEVQEFQEFIGRKNKYGGWNKYNHEIFVKSWLKYFGPIQYDRYELQDINIENSKTYNSFIREVFKNISGVTMEDIITHNKWYAKYVYLKYRQQKALEKWRNKKQVVKNPNRNRIANQKSLTSKENQNLKTKSIMNGLMLNNVDKKEINLEQNKRHTLENVDDHAHETLFSELDEVKDEVDEVFRDFQNNATSLGSIKSPYHKSDKISFKRLGYMIPTQQWSRRCNSRPVEDLTRKVNNVEIIQKRHVPEWRIGLQAI